MADFENVQPDEYKYLGCNYNPGRPQGIHGITIHHMAGNLSADDCNRVWANAETSAHYSIDQNGYIVQHVDDTDRAWACGNAYANDVTISIEHANNNSDPWTVFPAAIESGSHLVAALCKAYELGRPEWMVNVFPHKHWSSTACPGELAGSQNAQYMERAQYWYDAMCDGSKPSPAPQPSAPATSLADLGDVTVTYCSKVNGSWLPEVVNFNNENDDGFSGIPCNGMSAFAVKVDKGSVKYRAHMLGGDWLPWVTGYDINEHDNGYAGDGTNAIDGCQIYFYTPDGYKYQQAWYRSQTVAREGWLDVVCDDSDYAGIYGEGMDRLQIRITDHNPF